MEHLLNWIITYSFPILLICTIIFIFTVIFAFAFDKKNTGSFIVGCISLIIAGITLCFTIDSHNQESSHFLYDNESTDNSHNQANSYFLYDKVSTEKISDEYFENEMTYNDVQFAINELYAVYGHIFQTPGIQDYFLSKDWYTPKNKINDLYICLENDYEKYNFKKLIKYRDIKSPNN